MCELHTPPYSGMRDVCAQGNFANNTEWRCVGSMKRRYRGVIDTEPPRRASQSSTDFEWYSRERESRFRARLGKKPKKLSRAFVHISFSGTLLAVLGGRMASNTPSPEAKDEDDDSLRRVSPHSRAPGSAGRGSKERSGAYDRRQRVQDRKN